MNQINMLWIETNKKKWIQINIVSISANFSTQLIKNNNDQDEYIFFIRKWVFEKREIIKGKYYYFIRKFNINSRN